MRTSSRIFGVYDASEMPTPFVSTAWEVQRFDAASHSPSYANRPTNRQSHQEESRDWRQSPLCAGRAIGEEIATALTFLPIIEVRIEIEHLDAF